MVAAAFVVASVVALRFPEASGLDDGELPPLAVSNIDITTTNQLSDWYENRRVTRNLSIIQVTALARQSILGVLRLQQAAGDREAGANREKRSQRNAARRGESGRHGRGLGPQERASSRENLVGR